jgi:hypothetical protein
MIKFIEKEQDWGNESTRYWFNFEGDEYAVVESGGQSKIINEDGDEVYDRAFDAELKACLMVTDEMRAQ